MLTLADAAMLGAALAALIGEAIDILSCREERSEIEEAFLQLTGA